jgi:hypothetical protein
MTITTRSISRQFALALAVAAAAGAAQANLLINGSFENGSFTPGPYAATQSLGVGSTAITDWTVFNDTVAWIGVGNPWSLTASEGDRFLDLTDLNRGAPFGGVTQTIATIVGGRYSLSFDLGSSNLYGRPGAITASAGSTSQTFTSNPALAGNNDWERVSMSFTATANTTRIDLLGSAGVDYIGLDNADLVLVAVPEPASAALLVGGLAGLLALRRARAR